jgi:hypothetical protein
MRISHRLWLLPAACGLLLSGCARGPDDNGGGPVTPQAPNRMTVRMQLQQPVNNAYYYAFAFDDDDNTADGPTTITGSTVLPNGVVGGSYGVLVLYNSGQYTVYRRVAAGNSETLERVPNAFVTQPSTVTGQTFQFTLNLDAVAPSGNRLFRSPVTNGIPNRLDVNFITTNELRRDPNDTRLKAFDAFYNSQSGFGGRYPTIDIRSTRSYASSSEILGGSEPTNDVYNPLTSTQIDSPRLDMVDFSIAVQRGSTS